MSTTEILMLLAKNNGAYIFDDVGTGEIVLREADGSDMVLVDKDGRQVSPRFPYALIEGLIQQRYITQDTGVRCLLAAGIRVAGVDRDREPLDALPHAHGPCHP
jgi:hypothetical protein